MQLPIVVETWLMHQTLTNFNALQWGVVCKFFATIKPKHQKHSAVGQTNVILVDIFMSQYFGL